MATNILKDLKVNADFTDLLLSGVLKYYEERALSPFIGNGTFMSGAVKLGVGYFAPKFISGKMGKIVQTTFVMDGAEDIVQDFMKSFVGNASQQQNNLIL